MTMQLYFLLCLIFCLSSCVLGELVFVSIIYRHGDRTPIDFFPTDPYQNASYWPASPGQLTNTGKLQHYFLGKWFKDRYNSLVGEIYSKENVYVMSTDVDRTLMSAEANLAGFFPPKGKQVWDPAIRWQPIPVHTIPEKMDRVLTMKKSCPMYDLEKVKYMHSEEMVQFMAKYKPLFDYVTKQSGKLIESPSDLEFVYDTLFIEELYNLTLPEWTKAIYPEPMKTVSAFSFSIAAQTTLLKKLKGGPLLNEIIKHMVAKSKDKMKKKKLWIYSAHDTTVANFLNTLQLFDMHSPPYTATVMVELHKNNDKYFVNILYKNSTTVPPYNLSIPNCQFDCPLKEFIQLTKDVTITESEWETECHSNHFLDLIPNNDSDNLLATIVLFVMCVLLLLLLISMLVYLQQHSRTRNLNHYQRI